MINFTRGLSSLQASLLRRRTASDLTSQLNDAEREVATLRKADVYRSLGLRSAAAIDLRATVERNDGFIVANTQLQSRLDTMADIMKTVRDAAQSVFALAVPNRDRATQTASELQTAARAALDSIVGQMNTRYQGIALFGGIETSKTPLQSWDQTDAGTGLSPHLVMDTILGGGFANGTDAAAKAAEASAAFGNASGVGGHNFDATFYNGAPKTATHLNARIDGATAIDYGVQANDPAYVSILQGLAMLASTDVSQITDPAAYAEWTRVAVDALSNGVAGALDNESRLGTKQAQLARVLETQTARQDIFKTQILDLEGVDQYDAASRINMLEAQLQASYAVTARLSNLSFLNFMR